MEIQPPGRRAAQAIASVVIVVGALLLVTSIALVAGLILDHPGPLPPILVMGFLGVMLLVLGRKLLRWGSGDRE